MADELKSALAYVQQAQAILQNGGSRSKDRALWRLVDAAGILMSEGADQSSLPTGRGYNIVKIES